jgi:hypothetical protein
MRKASLAIGAIAALTFLIGTCSPAPAAEQGSAKPATAGSTKPNLGNGPADEKSLPSSAPAAKTTGTTGATDQNKTVKSMNKNEASKVEAGGK